MSLPLPSQPCSNVSIQDSTMVDAHFALPSPPESPWTLDLLKQRMSKGVVITDSVIDIGDGLVVKFGKRVCFEEGIATQFVATYTSVPVPRIHAILLDETIDWTFIIQDKLPGKLLVDLIPTLTESERTTLALELKSILSELSRLDLRGPMGMVGRAPYYDKGFCGRFRYCGPWKSHTPYEFVHWLTKRLDSSVTGPGPPVDDAAFDFTQSPIFSHGDFVPENILVYNGHISGIIDWECAGWYPYFWNDYIARRRRHLDQFWDGKWEAMLPSMMKPFPAEFEAFHTVFKHADIYL